MQCVQKRWRLAVHKIDQRIPCRLNYDAICHHISSNAVSGHTLGARPASFALVAMHISHIVKGFPCTAQDRKYSCPVAQLPSWFACCPALVSSSLSLTLLRVLLVFSIWAKTFIAPATAKSILHIILSWGCCGACWPTVSNGGPFGHPPLFLWPFLRQFYWPTALRFD